MGVYYPDLIEYDPIEMAKKARAWSTPRQNPKEPINITPQVKQIEPTHNHAYDYVAEWKPYDP